jgi:hypothetical protein
MYGAAHRKCLNSLICGHHNSKNNIRNEYKTIQTHTHTHTSHEHVSVRYDDTFYEECVSVILYGIVCCFM